MKTSDCPIRGDTPLGIITDAILVLPSGTPGKSPIEINLQAILIAEGRQGEVAFVTPSKAPELLSTFNRSWLEIHRMVTHMTAERNQAEKQVERRRAKLLLEEVPKILAAKDIASSADTRKAVIDLDEEFIALQDVYEQLNAIVELLKGKLKSFENAYTSVKKIIGDTSSHNYGNNPNLSGNTDHPEKAPVEQQPRRGWGSPKYGSK